MAKQRDQKPPTSNQRRNEWIKFGIMGLMMRPYPPTGDKLKDSMRMIVKCADALEEALEKALTEPETPADPQVETQAA